MFLLEILLALGLLQLWSGQNPLHRDEWFNGWLGKLSTLAPLQRNPYVLGAAVIFLPIVAVALVLSVIPNAIVFLLSIVVLVYCLGRGEFGSEVPAYKAACTDDDWERASRSAQRQGVDVDIIPTNDWPQLHEKMLEATAYQGFERLFAVLFWFVFLGPVGALLYRLSFTYKQARKEDDIAVHWLWALEWLPARVLGVSFAITGNFVGCVNRWREYLFCATSSASCILTQAVLGALSVDDELMESCDVSQREINGLKQLYIRTLWFWLAALALWVLLGPAKLWG